MKVMTTFFSSSRDSCFTSIHIYSFQNMLKKCYPTTRGASFISY
jgi:hypothetical protein